MSVYPPNVPWYTTRFYFAGMNSAVECYVSMHDSLGYTWSGEHDRERGNDALYQERGWTAGMPRVGGREGGLLAYPVSSFTGSMLPSAKTIKRESPAQTGVRIGLKKLCYE